MEQPRLTNGHRIWATSVFNAVRGLNTRQRLSTGAALVLSSRAVAYALSSFTIVTNSNGTQQPCLTSQTDPGTVEGTET